MPPRSMAVSCRSQSGRNDSRRNWLSLLEVTHNPCHTDPVEREIDIRRDIAQIDKGLGIRTLYGLIAEHGEVFTEFDDDPPAMMAMQECFANAARLAHTPGWTYCEGYCLSADIPIPIHHAWIVTDDGLIIDPTLRGARERGTQYLGLRIPDVWKWLEDYFGVFDNTGYLRSQFEEVRNGH